MKAPGARDLRDLGLALSAEAGAGPDTGAWAEAARCFQQAMDAGFEDEAVLSGYALALRRQGREEEAVRFWKAARDRRPDLTEDMDQAARRNVPGLEILAAVSHSGWISHLGFAADGRSAFLGSGNRLSRWAIGRRPGTGAPTPAKTPEEIYYQAGEVRSLCVSPDGRTVLTGGADGRLGLWQAADARNIRFIEAHDGPVTAVAFGPDGQSLASGGHDRRLYLWDRDTGERLQAYPGHEDEIMGAAFSPDGHSLMSFTAKGDLKVWDSYSDEKISTLTQPGGRLDAAVFTRDSRRVATGGEDRIIRVWEAKTGLLLLSIEGHQGRVSSLAAEPEGRLIFSGSHDKTLCWWDVGSGRLERTCRFDSRIEGLALSPDGRLILAVRASLSNPDAKTVCLLDRTLLAEARVSYAVTAPISADEADEREKAFLEEMAEARERIEAGDYHRGLESLARARDIPGYTRDTEALDLWRRLIPRFPSRGLRTAWERETLLGHQEEVTALAMGPDGRRLISADRSGAIWVWDLKTGRTVGKLTGHDGPVTSVRLSWDGLTAVSGGADRTLRLWDLENMTLVRTLLGHEGKVTAVGVSPDGRLALSGSLDGTLQLWDLVSQVAMRRFEGHQDVVLAVDFGPDGQAALSGSRDRTARVYEPLSGRTLRILKGHRGAVTAAAVGPDRRYLVTGSADEQVLLWEAAVEAHFETFKGHSAAVTSLAFCPDGRFVLSGSEDKTLRLWDLKTGRCLRTFEGHAAHITAVAFGPDRQFIVSASRDRVIRLWRLDWQPEIRPGAAWHEGARPFLENFLVRHTPFLAGSLRRGGRPVWTEEDFAGLLEELNRRGYGWLEAGGVRRELRAMARQRKGFMDAVFGLRDRIAELNPRELAALIFKKAFYVGIRLIPAALWTLLLLNTDLMGLSPVLAVITVLFFTFVMFHKRR